MTSPFVTVPSFTVEPAEAAEVQALATNESAILSALAPLCVIQRTTAQTIGTGSAAAISYTGTDIFDPLGVHDPSTNPSRITVPWDGWYLAYADFAWTSSATGTRGAHIFTNGTTVVTGSNQVRPGLAVTDWTMGVRVVPFQLTAGQYFEIRAFQNTGGNLDITATSADLYPVCTAFYLGEG